MTAPPTREDVLAAAARLAGQVVRTPVVRCPALDELAGAELWLKAESLQLVGAFKARGALNSLALLDPAVRARGVITYSSGNHAQAVAMAARRHGVPADIFMPVDAPQIKVAAVERMGARVTLVGTTSPERHEAALARQKETGAAIIEPFDHPHTIAGQGTATLELFEDAAAAGVALDALVVPVGGGGLIAGACLAAPPEVRIVCVEPVGCDS
ncbi:MAG TPA: pyridoxal-phosphate dependent enzyme, partial [Kofleriaceae bacterium]